MLYFNVKSNGNNNHRHQHEQQTLFKILRKNYLQGVHSTSIDESKKVSLTPVATIYSSEDPSSSVKIEHTKTHKQQQPQQQQNVLQSVKFQIPDVLNFRSQSFSAASEPNLNNFTKKEAETVNAVLSESATNSSIGLNPSHKKQSEQISLMRPSSRTLLGNLLPKPVSSCGHHNAGQELCYLCHQRQRRNNPVYLHEEHKQKDAEESQLLMQYQYLKDMDKQQKDEEKRNSQRLDRARMDAFNLGVSEAVKAKRNERPKTSDLSRSFVFRKRAKTPPKAHRQQDLSDYLAKQIEYKQKEANLVKQEMDYVERMEQLQLAEQLAAQREAYLKEKFQKQKDLKTTLDYQVKTKPAELPRVLPDGEVFGQNDSKNEKLALQKRREVDAFKFNKEIIEQRKREDLLNQLRDQEVAAENIERIKEENRIDRANRFHRVMSMRQGLEQDWVYANEEKKLRDQDEKEHRLAHDGYLVHEQCDKYRKCAQCQRDVKNCGETNIWKESRYTAGTRLMA